MSKTNQRAIKTVKIPHNGITYHFYPIRRGEIVCTGVRADESQFVFVNADDQNITTTWPDYATAIYDVLKIALGR